MILNTAPDSKVLGKCVARGNLTPYTIIIIHSCSVKWRLTIDCFRTAIVFLSKIVINQIYRCLISRDNSSVVERIKELLKCY